MVHSGGNWACHLVHPSLAGLMTAELTVQIIPGDSGCGGSNGIYVGITPADHNIAGQQAACGASTTFVYRCRDGWKRENGAWSPFATHCGANEGRVAPGATDKTERNGTGGYYASGNPRCRTIILVFERQAHSLTIYDVEDGSSERRLCGGRPLTTELPVDRELFFFVDTCDNGQGARIKSFLSDARVGTDACVGAGSSAGAGGSSLQSPPEPPIVTESIVMAMPVEAAGAAPVRTLAEQVEVLKRELGLSGTIKQVIHQAAQQLQVDLAGKPLTVVASSCLEVIGQ